MEPTLDELDAYFATLPPEFQQRWKEIVSRTAQQWADDFDAQAFREVYAAVMAEPHKP